METQQQTNVFKHVHLDTTEMPLVTVLMIAVLTVAVQITLHGIVRQNVPMAHGVITLDVWLSVHLDIMGIQSIEIVIPYLIHQQSIYSLTTQPKLGSQSAHYLHYVLETEQKSSAFKVVLLESMLIHNHVNVRLHVLIYPILLTLQRANVSSFAQLDISQIQIIINAKINVLEVSLLISLLINVLELVWRLITVIMMEMDFLSVN